MDAQQFAYWLQGFSELNSSPPTPEQWQSIREHLALVFAKVTPPVKAPSGVMPIEWANRFLSGTQAKDPMAGRPVVVC